MDVFCSLKELLLFGFFGFLIEFMEQKKNYLHKDSLQALPTLIATTTSFHQSRKSS